MLCCRLNLALDIMGYETTMPDCLMCVIIKDMFGSKDIEIKQGYDDIPLTYNDKTKGRQHIVELFNGGVISSPIYLHIFSKEVAERYYDGHNLQRLTISENEKSIFEANKNAAEFAILTDRDKG